MPGGEDVRILAIILVCLLAAVPAAAETPAPTLAIDRTFVPTEDNGLFPLLPWMAWVEYVPGTRGRLTLSSFALLLTPQVQWWMEVDSFGSAAHNTWPDVEARWEAGIAEIALFAADTNWYSTIRPDTVFVETDAAGRRPVSITRLLAPVPGEDPAMAVYRLSFNHRTMRLDEASWLRLIVLSDVGEHYFEWEFAG